MNFSMTDDRSARMDEAREHMTRVARGLAHVLSPIDAAGILAGGAIAVLAGTYGRAKAREYFAELVSELDREPEIIQ
jgi:hypothetical protein